MKINNLNNKKVILRLDLNVPIKDNKILSKERIVASLPTIKYLIDENAKIIIMSHLGKIKSEEDKRENTLYPVYEELLRELNTNVYFSSATEGEILENKINSLKPGEVLLMENTRYNDYPDKRESLCNDELAKYYASLADIFVNDAFGLSHRKHTTNYGIAKYLPTYYGLLMEKELNGLKPLLNPERPFTIIMGGAKVSDKIKIIEKILPKCDYLLIGGGIANSFIACNHNIGKSLADLECQETLKELIEKYPEKIVLPIDVIVQDDNVSKNKQLDEIQDDDIIYDIGCKTIGLFKEIICKSKMIFINGTLGLYENSNYENGTKEILEFISSQNSIKIAGGGDALASIDKFNIHNITFKSTGGGATLKFIAEDVMEIEK